MTFYPALLLITLTPIAQADPAASFQQFADAMETHESFYLAARTENHQGQNTSVIIQGVASPHPRVVADWLGPLKTHNYYDGTMLYRTSITVKEPEEHPLLAITLGELWTEGRTGFANSTITAVDMPDDSGDRGEVRPYGETEWVRVDLPFQPPVDWDYFLGFSPNPPHHIGWMFARDNDSERYARARIVALEWDVPVDETRLTAERPAWVPYPPAFYYEGQPAEVLQDRVSKDGRHLRSSTPEAFYNPDDFPEERKVVICHNPPGNPENQRTLEISHHALAAHLEHHGDREGRCEDLDSSGPDETNDGTVSSVGCLGCNGSTGRGPGTALLIAVALLTRRRRP